MQRKSELDIESGSSTYHSLASGAYDQHGDLEGAVAFTKKTKQVLSSIGHGIADCCSVCCMNCASCMRALGDVANNLCKALVVNGYNGLIRPVGYGVAEIFKAKNNEYRWYQPGMDLTVGAIGNPATVFLVDPFFTITEEGESEFFPLANPMGRCIEFFQFLNKSAHCIDPRKNLVAAAAILTLSLYFSTTLAATTNALLTDHPLTLNVFNPQQGIQAITQFLSGNPTLWQKIVIPMSVYFGLTNGYAAGKQLTGFDFTAWQAKFSADVSKDSLHRHLEELEDLDETTARQAHDIYKTAVKQGKAWKAVDVFGRGLEGVLKVPAHLFQKPARLVWGITGAKAWEVVQGVLPSPAEVKASVRAKFHATVDRAKASSCATAFLKCIGRKTPKQIVKEENEAKHEFKVPTFEMIMQQRRSDYGLMSAAGNRTLGFLSRNPRDGRQIRLERELEASYMRDVVNHRMQVLEFVPSIVLPNAPPPAYNEAWVSDVRANSSVQRMLVGDFPNQSASAAEKATRYQAYLYAIYSNQPEKIAELDKNARPPTYADSLQNPNGDAGVGLYRAPGVSSRP